MKKAKKWIDDAPPRRALHYRQVLRQTPYTKGGFPRVDGGKLTKPKKKKKRRGGSLLPERRSVMGSEYGSEMGDSRMLELDEMSPGRSQSAMSASNPKWALEGEADEYGDDTFEEEE